MEIKFLGTGGAFDSEYGNSAALVRCNGKTFLIDCGFTTFATLKQFDLFGKIDFVLITHLHNDHTGSLVNTLLYYFLHVHRGEKMKVIYPTKKFKKQLSRFLSIALMNADDFVEWVPLKSVKEVQCIDTFGLHVEEYQTYSYIFREAKEVMVFSGDIGDGDFIFRKLKKKKIKSAIVFHELVFDPVPGHTLYSSLMSHQNEYRIYGYHCDPRKNKPDNTVPLVADHPEFLFPQK
ncbi:MAG: MBL fold metallo-hydrolase [Chitinophagales bacterium]